MTSFIDKIKVRKRVNSSASEPVLHSPMSPENGNITFEGGTLTLQSPEHNSHMKHNAGDLGRSAFDGSSRIQRKSRLCKTLLETLMDPSALHYLLQYMEQQNVLHLLKFWLDAESFRVAASSVLDKNKTTNDNDEHISGDKNNEPKLNSALDTMTKEDAVNIFSKYIAKDANPNIGVTEKILNQVVDRICPESGSPDPDCFVHATNFVFKILETRYFVGYVSSVFHMQHILDVINSPSLDLSDVMASDVVFGQFTEFLDIMRVKHLAEFLLATDSFKTDLLSHNRVYDPAVAQTDAMLLYDKYISMQACQSIGLSENVRIGVENEICRQEGIQPYCFDTAVKIVFHQLQSVYLPLFVQSDPFRVLVSNLQHTIRNTLMLPDVGGRRKFRGSSDRSSSLSLGSSSQGMGEGRIRFKNTLLAGQSPPVSTSNQRRMSNASSEDITLSPDLLSSRRERNKFNVRVDEYGNYKRDYDTSDLALVEQKTSSAKIAEKVKSTFRKDKTREEEIAAQMAQLIVQNVTQMAGGNFEEINLQ